MGRRAKREDTKGLTNRNGIWYLNLMVNGKRERGCLKTTSLDLARKLRDEKLAELEAVSGLSDVNMPLPAFAKAAVASYEVGPKGTLGEVERAVKRFVALCSDPAAPEFRVERISEVRRPHVDALLKRLRGAGLTAKSVNKDLDLLRAAWNRLAPELANPFRGGPGGVRRLPEKDSRTVPALPLEDLRAYFDYAMALDGADDLPETGGSLPPARWLGSARRPGWAGDRPTDLARVRRAAREWFRDMFLFVLCTGARIGGAYALTRRDVHFAENVVDVPLPKTHRSAKDRTTRHWMIAPVRAMLARRCADLAEGDLVFGKHAKYAFAKMLARIRGRHPDLPACTPHQLRHSWATIIGRHTDRRVAMTLGGWTKEDMLNRYDDPDMKAKRAALEAFAAEVLPPAPAGTVIETTAVARPVA